MVFVCHHQPPVMLYGRMLNRSMLVNHALHAVDHQDDHEVATDDADLDTDANPLDEGARTT